MATVKVKALREHLCCSICMEVYTNPVTLSCQHHFCSECIQNSLRTQEKCPVCRANTPRDSPRNINRTLRDLAEEMRAESKASAWGNKPALAPKPTSLSSVSAPLKKGNVCQAHNDPLKLYCETDRRLICVICRDGKEHRGHSFKPMSEAKEEISESLIDALFHLQEDITAVESFRQREGDFAEQTRDRNAVLRAQLKIRFSELHELLLQREKKAVKRMEDLDLGCSRQLADISQVLEEGRARQTVLKSGRSIQDPMDFLRWWTQEGYDAAQEATSDGRYSALLHELKQGPLMRMCPPPSPERAWFSGGSSHAEQSPLKSLVGFVAADHLEMFLSRHIHPPTEEAENQEQEPLYDGARPESDIKSYPSSDLPNLADSPLPASQPGTKKKARNLLILKKK